MSYFSLQTEKYESFESTNPRWVDGNKKFLDYFLPFPKESRILDIGCGEGLGLAYLKSLGYEKLFGVEMNPRKAQQARKIATVFEQDAHEMEISSKFDVVIMSHFLEHATDPVKVLKATRKLMQPSGRLLVVVPFPDAGPDDAHVGKYMLGTDKGDFNQVKSVFADAGFTLKDFKLDAYREPEIWLHFALS